MSEEPAPVLPERVTDLRACSHANPDAAKLNGPRRQVHDSIREFNGLLR